MPANTRSLSMTTVSAALRIAAVLAALSGGAARADDLATPRRSSGLALTKNESVAQDAPALVGPAPARAAKPPAAHPTAREQAVRARHLADQMNALQKAE